MISTLSYHDVMTLLLTVHVTSEQLTVGNESSPRGLTVVVNKSFKVFVFFKVFRLLTEVVHFHKRYVFLLPR